MPYTNKQTRSFVLISLSVLIFHPQLYNIIIYPERRQQSREATRFEHHKFIYLIIRRTIRYSQRLSGTQ